MPDISYPAELLIKNAVKQRVWRRSGMSLLVAVVGLLGVLALGLAMVIGAQPRPNDTSAPSCGGQTMNTDQVCDEYTNGIRTSTSYYQDMVDERNHGDTGVVVAGGVATAAALLAAIPLLRAYNPRKPWGAPLPLLCPRCGGPHLREKTMSHSITVGRIKTTYRGTVTLCTPDCGFTTARRPDPVTPKQRRSTPQQDRKPPRRYGPRH
ncbi:hypothetical protein [Kitasatospora sp. LaBMicrA B282]|uniref:hypothetical protein n=1 Tax=Kitasatospora sp. LaBMicrA B282 TaxID=3420949 RepID=UPI003D0B9386